MDVKIVGDIRNGKFQPTLTGNPIVDDALIDNFCKNLKSKITAIHDVSVSVDHFFNPDAKENSIIVIDDSISKYLDNEVKKNNNLINVNHTDMLHGSVDNIVVKLADYLNKVV
ncbi:hypothetical protein PL11_008160 [Lentilactobacillus curieae]|uniref:Uncharacterized protein n=1 Tax=Lentilactobacillus curieae TaxID=1138822 RepID=A0A1S6QJT7_9LACO|nr:hypothetical protein [Lentilactobacillus curieae]AQW21888.1 hypothetical protein PL11_008160 [Lentilactobacillus curieae]